MKKRILFLVLSLFPLCLHAEPKVIFEDEKRTQSFENYNRVFTKTESIRSGNKILRSLVKDNGDKSEDFAKQLAVKINDANNSWLPITTPELSFSEIEDEEVYFPNVSRPVCVIGNDTNSMKWIDAHKEYLKKINAYCWLVEVASKEDIKRIYSHTKGLQVIPAKGSVLSEVFGIKHYPLLITSRKIMQ